VGEVVSEKKFLHHGERKVPFTPSAGDSALIEAVSDHVERWLGPIASVFHEILSDLVHVDLHWVRPTERRPWNTLVTSGMSERPMAVPPGAEMFARAELVLNLPAAWPMEHSAWQESRHYWPIRMLKSLARLPHEYETWLSYGHTVAADGEGATYDGSTTFSGVILAPPITAPPEFMTLERGGERTCFWSVIPLYPEELDFKVRQGTDALFDRLTEYDVLDVVAPGRRNVCRRRWFSWRS
jgi:hypothetical protein